MHLPVTSLSKLSTQKHRTHKVGPSEVAMSKEAVCVAVPSETVLGMVF